MPGSRAIPAEQGGNEDEVSARGDRKELGEPLNRSPQDGIQHCAEVRGVLRLKKDDQGAFAGRDGDQRGGGRAKGRVHGHGVDRGCVR